MVHAPDAGAAAARSIAPAAPSCLHRATRFAPAAPRHPRALARVRPHVSSTHAPLPPAPLKFGPFWQNFFVRLNMGSRYFLYVAAQIVNISGDELQARAAVMPRP